MFDFLIVGCGLAGSVMAERLASQQNKKVLIIDKRSHIGGNCYDYYDNGGVLVHKYGPHYFRTNLKHVFDYLSKFTEWHYFYYKIRVMVDGRLVPLPINLDTVNEIYGYNFSSEELKAFYNKHKSEIKNIDNSEDVIISKVGKELYEKIYKSYTIKQWGLEPKDLDASVCARIPVRYNRDERYFTDKYQAMPKRGYHKMFENMLNHPNIYLMLQTEFRDVEKEIKYRKLIWTGPIDAFFDYQYGKLPYRSLRFEHETLDMGFYQPVVQVNYPTDYDYTRIVEIKHATGQIHPKTTIAREYPMDEGEPFYPIPRPENYQKYLNYENEAAKIKNVYFVGRLAQYKYLNMDQVIDLSLKLFQEIKEKKI